MTAGRFGTLDALRVLLGTVMVVTALQYFLPALLGFLPTATWEDPMSVRLMTMFDRSGLLAVAKFIHLVAGALLLVNRGVPFSPDVATVRQPSRSRWRR